MVFRYRDFHLASLVTDESWRSAWLSVLVSLPLVLLFFGLAFGGDVYLGSRGSHLPLWFPFALVDFIHQLYRTQHATVDLLPDAVLATVKGARVRVPYGKIESVDASDGVLVVKYIAQEMAYANMVEVEELVLQHTGFESAGHANQVAQALSQAGARCGARCGVR